MINRINRGKSKEKPILLGAKVSVQFHQRIKKVCEARGEDVSSFVRRAAKRELASLGLLSEAEGKALGLPSDSWAIIQPAIEKVKG